MDTGDRNLEEWRREGVGLGARRREVRLPAVPSTLLEVDAVVLGAGTAGANAAYQLASRGLSVAVVQRGDLAVAGAQWHNGVLDWQFERAGLVPPAPPERIAQGAVGHIFGPDGTHAVTVTGSPIARADMALLGTRLRSLAVDAGAELIDRATDLRIDVRAGRIVGLDVVAARPGEQAAPLRLEAPLFVDAAGRHGVLRSASPALAPSCAPVVGRELCTAGDHLMRIADRDGALRFLERHHARPGESVNVVGLHGGWSTRSITVAEDLDHVSVLVGCVADGRFGRAADLLRDARAAEPWLGDPYLSGVGLIPLRRPYARFTAPGLALVGDAACQVFPAHGSGIGLGLIAGRMLADAVADATDPGDERTLWAYQATFQRELGGTLAAFDGFRRMSTALGSSGITTMVGAGLLTESLTRAGLDQRWSTPPKRDLPVMAGRLLRVPGLAARMLPMLARGQVLHAMGERYPVEVDEVALARWDRRVERLLGPLPS